MSYCLARVGWCACDALIIDKCFCGTINHSNVYHVSHARKFVSVISANFNFICLSNLRPSENMKLQEKSSEDVDKSAVEAHLKFLENWGKQVVWNGVTDVVSDHMGNAVSRRSSADRSNKDVKHLLS